VFVNVLQSIRYTCEYFLCFLLLFLACSLVLPPHLSFVILQILYKVSIKQPSLTPRVTLRVSNCRADVTTQLHSTQLHSFYIIGFKRITIIILELHTVILVLDLRTHTKTIAKRVETFVLLAICGLIFLNCFGLFGARHNSIKKHMKHYLSTLIMWMLRAQIQVCIIIPHYNTFGLGLLCISKIPQLITFFHESRSECNARQPSTRHDKPNPTHKVGFPVSYMRSQRSHPALGVREL
jgi:hypothetical protein